MNGKFLLHDKTAFRKIVFETFTLIALLLLGKYVLHYKMICSRRAEGLSALNFER